LVQVEKERAHGMSSSGSSCADPALKICIAIVDVVNYKAAQNCRFKHFFLMVWEKYIILLPARGTMPAQQVIRRIKAEGRCELRGKKDGNAREIGARRALPAVKR
jgi:hypothetical protein